MLPTLFQMLPQPMEPKEAPTRADWERYAWVTGITLPDDYTHYVTRYGTGVIGGSITPYNPFCMRKDWKPYYTCRHWMRQALGTKEAQHTFGAQVFPYALYPEPEGVFPWGGTDNGDMLYWMTKGDPNEWTVVVNEVRSSHFEAFNYTMTGFLHAWITGQIQSDILPYHEIDHDLLFGPF